MMVATTEIKPQNERFAAFVGELTGIAGKTLGNFEKYVVTKVDELAAGNESLSGGVKKIRENKETIATALFYVGCIYNLYTSPFLFTAGTALGAVTSASRLFVTIETLRQGELLGRTEKDGYAAQKTMALCAFINFYLGRTHLDDMFFGIFTGLMAGNSFWHMFLKQSQAGGVIIKLGENTSKITETVLAKIPVIGPALGLVKQHNPNAIKG